jgi:hypothetical protein
VVDTTSQPVVAVPRVGVRNRAASTRAWLGARVTTTPGKLVLLSVLVVTGAVCFGLIASAAERSRARAANGVRAETEPLLVQSALLYTALSDANATATTTFLKGGLEPPVLRARYLGDLRVASDSLATLTRQARGTGDVDAALKSITEHLPVYSGLVEAARANNRQGFPVGAAYLRSASSLLTVTILPEADRVYATETTRLSSDYGTGTAIASLIVLVIAVVLALALLAGAQVYLARMTRRVINVPMAGATALLLALSIWSVVGLIAEQNALASARRASDSVELLSASRVLLSRSQSDQSLILANRGSDLADPADFSVVMRALAPPRGLLGAAASSQTSAADQRLKAEFAAYRSETDRIGALEQSGKISQATNTDASGSEGAVLSRDLSELSTASQNRFTADATDATASLAGLAIAIPVLTVIGAALAVFGLAQRLEEYR